MRSFALKCSQYYSFCVWVCVDALLSCGRCKGLKRRKQRQSLNPKLTEQSYILHFSSSWMALPGMRRIKGQHVARTMLMIYGSNRLLFNYKVRSAIIWWKIAKKEITEGVPQSLKLPYYNSTIILPLPSGFFYSLLLHTVLKKKRRKIMCDDFC